MKVSRTVELMPILRLLDLEPQIQKFRLASLNVGTMRGRVNKCLQQIEMLLGINARKMTGEFWLLVIKKEHYQRLLNEEFESH